jgi:hypothetical protein
MRKIRLGSTMRFIKDEIDKKPPSFLSPAMIDVWIKRNHDEIKIKEKFIKKPLKVTIIVGTVITLIMALIFSNYGASLTLFAVNFFIYFPIFPTIYTVIFYNDITEYRKLRRAERIGWTFVKLSCNCKVPTIVPVEAEESRKYVKMVGMKASRCQRCNDNLIVECIWTKRFKK